MEGILSDISIYQVVHLQSTDKLPVVVDVHFVDMHVFVLDEVEVSKVIKLHVLQGSWL